MQIDHLTTPYRLGNSRTFDEILPKEIFVEIIKRIGSDLLSFLNVSLVNKRWRLLVSQHLHLFTIKSFYSDGTPLDYQEWLHLARLGGNSLKLNEWDSEFAKQDEVMSLTHLQSLKLECLIGGEPHFFTKFCRLTHLQSSEFDIKCLNLFSLRKLKFGEILDFNVFPSNFTLLTSLRIWGYHLSINNIKSSVFFKNFPVMTQLLELGIAKVDLICPDAWKGFNQVTKLTVGRSFEQLTLLSQLKVLTIEDDLVDFTKLVNLEKLDYYVLRNFEAGRNNKKLPAKLTNLVLMGEANPSLEGLTSLKKLYCSGDVLSQILTSLVNLSSLKICSGTQSFYSSLLDLKNPLLTSLRKLTISSFYLTDEIYLPPLRSLVNLRKLNLGIKYSIDFTIVHPNLEYLRVYTFESGRKINLETDWSLFPKLTTLCLTAKEITNYRRLTCLTQLKSLHITENTNSTVWFNLARQLTQLRLFSIMKNNSDNAKLASDHFYLKLKS